MTDELGDPARHECDAGLPQLSIVVLSVRDVRQVTEREQDRRVEELPAPETRG